MKLLNFTLAVFALFSILSLFDTACNAQSLLKVGDKAPPLNIYKWIKGTPVKTLQKGQVYMVEFGATWCHPCSEAIPHLTEIARKYKNNLQVIGVFIMEYRKDSLDLSYVPRVERYVKNMGAKLDYRVFADGPKKKMENNWIHAAGLQGIPETFIIDKDGMIAWMGYASPQTLDLVVGLVNAPDYKLSEAVEHSKLLKMMEQPRIESSKPMFMDSNGGEGKDIIFRSMLTTYHGEESGNSEFIYTRDWAKYDPAIYTYPGLVQQIGVPLGKLYYLAYADTIGTMMATRYVDGTPNYPDTIKYPTLRNSYGKYWYKIILDLHDSGAFNFNFRSFKNLYNYSLVVTDKNTTARFLQQAMRNDLASYFGYTVTVENRMMPCWNLIASDSARSLLKTKTPGHEFARSKINDTLFKATNAIMKDILILFKHSFSYGEASYGIEPLIDAPFIDVTGISGEIDYNMSENEFLKFRNHDWKATLDFIHRLGLDLVREQKEMKVVVIRDPKSTPN